MWPAQNVAHWKVSYATLMNAHVFNESGTLPSMEGVFVNNAGKCRYLCNWPEHGGYETMSRLSFHYLEFSVAPGAKIYVEGVHVKCWRGG